MKTVTKVNELFNFLLVIVAAFSAGCGKGADATATNDTSAAEVTASTIAGQATAADATIGFQERGYVPLWQKWAENVQSKIIPEAWATSCSTFIAGGSACGGGVTSNYTLGGCNPAFAPAASWTGTWVYTFNTNAACLSAKTTGLMTTGASNTFTTTSSVPGVTRAAGSGVYVNMDTDVSGYSVPSNGGTQITCGGSGCPASRNIRILGLHRSLYSSSSAKISDHTIKTTSDLVMTGTDGTRQITSGTIVVQHNLARFTATTNVVSALTHTSGCCFPTGGSLQTTYTGSKTGTETITFQSTCGKATVGSIALTLTHCI